MRIPLTLYNLLHQKLRAFVAITGIAFSVLLIFMQIGFYDSAVQTATLFLSSLDFDVILISTDYLDVNRPGSFPRYRLYQTLAAEGAAHAAPVYVGVSYWRIRREPPAPLSGDGPPESFPVDPSRSGFQRGIMIVAFQTEDPVFRNEEVMRQREKLRLPGNVLMDSATRHFFGDRDIGVATELGLVQVRVVGKFRIGTGYGADGMVIVSDRTYAQVFGGQLLDRVSLGLVKLQPGSDPGEAAGRIRGLLDAADVRVLTRDEMLSKERDFWINKTSLGIIFTLGVLVALTVGAVFVYQVLATDIGNRFAEYATLKAIGYDNFYLSRLVLKQALLYGVLGYLPGLAGALLLYAAGQRLANLPLWMTWDKVGLVFLLGVAMASVSALFAVRKVQRADPADLF